MQKKDLIPTPLVDYERRPVQIVESIPPGPFRLVLIMGFILRISWLWWRTALAIRFTGKASTRKAMAEVRAFLEKMGGMWVKAGQIVAMRRDVFQPETCDELSALQDRAQGFSFDLVRQTIEEDLGGPIEEFFSDFQEQPLAAASIGQTHEARLLSSGVRVAVKVQRPFVAESFARDLRYAWFVVFWMKRFAVGLQARWDEMAWELEKTLTEELDYRMEASALARMRKTLREHDVYAPKVFHRYSGRRVLVMEYVEGVFMSDYIKVAKQDPRRLADWLLENDIDPAKVGERLVLSHNRQIFEDNLYHADLHPGNILLQRHSKIALIDFGTVGSFDKSLLQKYHFMFAALADRDHLKVADMFLLMSPPLPNRDMVELKTEIVRTLRVWESRTAIKRLPYHEKSLTALNMAFPPLLAKYAVPSNWEFLRLNRSDLTLDASLMFLIPEIDYPKLCRKYERGARTRALREASKPKTIRRALGGLATAAQLPAMIAENLYFEAQWTRNRALAFEGKISKVAQFARSALYMFRMGVLVASAIFLGHYLYRYHPARFGFLGNAWTKRVFDALPEYRQEVWIAITLTALYLTRMLLNVRRHVEEKEYDRPGR